MRTPSDEIFWKVEYQKMQIEYVKVIKKKFTKQGQRWGRGGS